MGNESIGNLNAFISLNSSGFMLGMASVERKLRTVEKKFMASGKAMTAAITVPLAIIGGAGVKAFADFDDKMTKSLAIMGNVSNEMKGKMKDAAIEMSLETTTSASKAAEAYFFLASAGLDAEQSVASLGAVNQFAIAGNFDMATATDLATDAQSALGLTVKDAQKNLENMTRVTDVLVGANTLANASVQQFANSLTSDSATAMRAYNIELEEGVAVLAAYADQGIKAEEAGSMFGRMLRLLNQSFMKNTGAWRRFGLDIYDATGELKPMYQIIQDLEGAFKGMATEEKTAALKLLGFEALSQKAILPLLGMGDAIERYNNKLKDMSGITKEVADKNMASFSAQLKIIWNNVKEAGRQIGEILAPYVAALGQKIKQASKFFMGLNQETKILIVQLGLFAAAIGPVTLGIGLMSKAVTSAITTFRTLGVVLGLTSATTLLIVAAVAILAASAYALRAAWIQNLTVIKDRMEDWLNGFKDGLEWLATNPIGEFLIWMVEGFVLAFNNIKKHSNTFLADLSGLFSGAGAWIMRMKEAIEEGWDARSFKEMIADIKEGINEASDEFYKTFADTSDDTQVKVDEFTEKIKESVKTANFYVKGFGGATVDHLKELLAAVKTQFSEDVQAIISNLQQKMEEVKASSPTNPTEGNDWNAIAGNAEDDPVTQQASRWQQAWDDAISAIKPKYEEWATSASDIWTNIADVGISSLDSLSQGLTDMITEGNANFREMTRNILKQLLQVLIRAIMVQAIMLALGLPVGMGSAGGGGSATQAGMPSSAPGMSYAADGAVMANGRMTPFALGGVVDSPHMFAMKNGTGLMGEAGPEGILPLARDGQGRLGVRSENENQNIKIVNVMDQNEILAAMSSSAGERVVMNAIRRNPGIVKGATS